MCAHQTRTNQDTSFAYIFDARTWNYNFSKRMNMHGFQRCRGNFHCLLLADANAANVDPTPGPSRNHPHQLIPLMKRQVPVYPSQVSVVRDAQRPYGRSFPWELLRIQEGAVLLTQESGVWWWITPWSSELPLTVTNWGTTSAIQRSQPIGVTTPSFYPRRVQHVRFDADCMFAAVTACARSTRTVCPVYGFANLSVANRGGNSMEIEHEWSHPSTKQFMWFLVVFKFWTTLEGLTW